MIKKNRLQSLLLVMFIVSSMMLASQTLYADANTVVDETEVTIDAGMMKHYAITLDEDAGMGGRFRIRDGDGIYFVILSQFDHDRVQDDDIFTNPLNLYKDSDYARDGGVWYYWNFTAPVSDTWYVYFSKASGTTYMWLPAVLDIKIFTETDAPTLDFVSPTIPISGEITIDFTAEDDAFTIEKVQLIVDGVIVDETINPNMATGWQFTGSVSWDTTQVQNDNYSLSLRVSDTFGRSRAYPLGPIEVENSNDLLWLFVVIIGVVGIGIILCVIMASKDKR